ncbi:prolyl oligopeptidase family serine peptidase [Seonamhaeicola aphaedonensis]|uniref:prolyl oligopeptidase n=1 Tax=Seonamhaeicola aphaedonensis TaxID=1461338 RepID=A0A3D9HMG9_9FLAO|nr:prolyl oligopeptidase family serine peptidase [Seonamhaeicola aphaedonensis]RED50697.1 prolyl oligopeptidase [Seonamhaeicola aphaedonensis]
MKIVILAILSIFMILACENDPSNKNNFEVTYPKTNTVDTVDTYFGVEVKDPYRWLENDMSEETAKWIESQNLVTHNYLNKIPFKNDLKERLSKLWNYEKVSAPFKEGNNTYYYKNNGLQNHYVLYRKKENGEEDVFLDPNSFSKDGSTSLDAVSFSKNGSLLAYSISEDGSDWRKIIVMDTETKEHVGDTIFDVKFTQISWYKNEGFYYSSYDKPKGSELSTKTDQHKVYYHKLGTPQKEDKLVFGGTPEEKHRYIYAGVTQDDNYLIISPRISTTGNKLYIKDLSKKDSSWITILDHNESNTAVLDNDGSTLYLVTNLDAPNKRIVKVYVSNPTPENWVDIIPETNFVLQPSSSGKYIIAKYMVDAISKVMQYDYNGNLIRDIKLPGVGNTNGFGSKKEETVDYFSFTNYVTPSSIYKLNLETGKTELYWKPSIEFNSNAYESNQVFYLSKDGTKIPMIITHKKGLELNGKNPTILYGYGGFNISLNPTFSIGMAVWMEQGGVYAVPNIRGGGEYGKKWHDAGIKTKKQNVFDDFIAAAEYLFKNQYTSSEYLAIRGGSNGGLLVGAVMTQKPDLAKVVLPAVGVLDMLRYHTFTAGAGWAYDYGTAEDSKEMFEYLKGYSPLHNIKEGTEYPATLVTTGDHDDRVVPAHSFKFAAELQSKQAGNNPTLIRIETDAGHGAGTPVSKIIEQYADIFSFALFNMGYDVLPYKKKKKDNR